MATLPDLECASSSYPLGARWEPPGLDGLLLPGLPPDSRRPVVALLSSTALSLGTHAAACLCCHPLGLPDCKLVPATSTYLGHSLLGCSCAATAAWHSAAALTLGEQQLLCRVGFWHCPSQLAALLHSPQQVYPRQAVYSKQTILKKEQMFIQQSNADRLRDVILQSTTQLLKRMRKSCVLNRKYYQRIVKSKIKVYNKMSSIIPFLLKFF